MRPLSLAVLILLSAAALVAQTEAPLDFPKGPAQWIMTADERNAWKRVKTEEEAAQLVALFWARRDPTPGDLPNEFRDEFKTRVNFADTRFKEGSRRGALTERGRVLVTLGIPRAMATEASKRSGQYDVGAGGGGADPTGGRALAAREDWNYTYEESIKFGMPKIEVVFIHDGMSGRVRRDTQRNDFISAIPAATKYYIKSPELTAVPEWAKAGALQFEPARPAVVQASEDVRPSASDPQPSQSESVQAAPKAEGRGPKAEPALQARPASIGKLTLVADAFSLEPENGKDPFAGLASMSEFRRDAELGWVVEYCTGSLDRALSEVEVTLKISGLLGGEKVNFNAPPEDMVPDAIKASPGCYLVRGGVPLMDLDPANYTIFVKIGSYNLTKDFRVIE